jgi:hypothetical protein
MQVKTTWVEINKTFIVIQFESHVCMYLYVGSRYYHPIVHLYRINTMFSVEVPSSSVAVLQQFCDRHAVSPSTIFQLTWALIQNCYFDTSDFLYEENGVDEDIQTLISFLPELTKESRVISTLQSDGSHETILLRSGLEGVDASLRKVWSRLKISHDTTTEDFTVLENGLGKDVCRSYLGNVNYD